MNESATRSGRVRFFGPAVRFPILFLALSFLLMYLVGGPLRELVQPNLCALVAVHSGWALSLLGESAKSSGDIVSSPRHTFQVIYSCTSLPATIVLLSAVLAFPATWLRKLVGVVTGVLILYGVNIVRLVVLYYVFLHYREFYDRIHLTVWQGVLVIIAIVIFSVWANWSVEKPADEPA